MGKETTTNSLQLVPISSASPVIVWQLDHVAQLSSLLSTTKLPSYLEVFHLGKHTCAAKPLQKDEDDKFLQENIREFGTTLGPKELAKVKMSVELRNQMSTGKYDMTKIVDIASKFTDCKKVANMKKK